MCPIAPHPYVMPTVRSHIRQDSVDGLRAYFDGLAQCKTRAATPNTEAIGADRYNPLNFSRLTTRKSSSFLADIFLLGR